MWEWGVLGLGDGTSGNFLAQHYSHIGPYFGKRDGHDWPHNPLNNEPSQLELSLNEKLIEITELMSNGSLKNISILDLPAFGSTIARLEKHHKIKSNWPTEINFEIQKSNQNSVDYLFTEYKNLHNDWTDYMMRTYKKDGKAIFTQTMAGNKLSDFTRHIKSDMKTFLIAIHASFLNPSKIVHPIWRTVAQEVFRDKKDYNEVLSRGTYDQLIMKCGLRKNLLNENMDVDIEGGCELFLPTLTSNGFCHTFNGQTPFETWRKAEMIKAFQQVFPTEHLSEMFQGAGASEGKIICFKHSSNQF
jgi:hypothetical protein